MIPQEPSWSPAVRRLSNWKSHAQHRLAHSHANRTHSEERHLQHVPHPHPLSSVKSWYPSIVCISHNCQTSRHLCFSSLSPPPRNPSPSTLSLWVFNCVQELFTDSASPSSQSARIASPQTPPRTAPRSHKPARSGSPRPHESPRSARTAPAACSGTTRCPCPCRGWVPGTLPACRRRGRRTCPKDVSHAERAGGFSTYMMFWKKASSDEKMSW